MKKYQKHTKLTSTNIGNFGRNEFSILGTSCDNIKKLAYSIIDKISLQYKVGYVDADHKRADKKSISSPSSLSYNASQEYTDKINFHRFDTLESLNEYQLKQQFNAQDLILINGNHFKASKQIIIIDAKKPILKKLEKLTNVVLILFQESETEIPEYIKNYLSEINAIPSCSINEIDNIVNLIKREVKKSIPTIKGLVLAGGKSERMQKDKGKIDYHGKEQRMFMYDLLTKIISKSYLSIRAGQSSEFKSDISIITDNFVGLGAYGGILSAFQSDPNSAWLVTACDQPYLDETTLSYLISKRNPSKFATAFYNPETGFPEPLITLWESKAYLQFLYFLSLGYSCPRKVLINSDIALVKLVDTSVLKNVNTPEEHKNYWRQVK